MPNFNDAPPFFTEKQIAISDASASFKILELCTILKATLTDITKAQIQLDDELWPSSPVAYIETALHRIRAARQRCGEMVDELLRMSPTTLNESVALNKVLTAYLAQVDVDRMTCHLHFDVALGSRRLVSEVISPKTKSARTFSVNVIPCKRRLKVSFPPRSR